MKSLTAISDMTLRELQNPLASMILEGKVADGQTVRVGVEAAGLSLGVAEEADKPKRKRA